MLLAVLSLAVVFVCLATSELLWRLGILRGEVMRKSVHMAVAGFVAFWPWLMSWNWIRLIGLAFIAGVIINRKFNIFHMLAGLRRTSLGDIDFAIVILACALVTNVKIFFCLAILHLALADGAAALIGKQADPKWRYRIFGQEKSVIGSMAFWLVSLGILGIGGVFAHSYLSYQHYLIALVILPPALTVLESVSTWGVDNLTIPLAVIVALRLLS